LPAPGLFAQAPGVPEEFQDLSSELSVNINSFRNTVASGWNGAKWPVVFAAHLAGGNPHVGATMLSPSWYTGALLELDGLKALGVQGISLDIGFPILYEPFHGSPATYQQYLSFYQQLVGDIRARGMKVIAESQVMLSDPVYTNVPVGPFYRSLTLEQYRQARAEMIRTIAQQLHPDYISVISEPDTEAEQTGKPELGTPEGSTALLNEILAGLQQAGVGGLRIGAGVGTWQASYLDYINSYAATSVAYINIHIYPTNMDYFTRAITIADTARSHGKQVAVGEAWLFKVRENELDTLSYAEVYERDVFSFWAPLDAFFLQALVDFSHYKQLEFISPFWDGYFRGYLEYTEQTKGLSYDEKRALTQEVQGDNMMAGQYSSTGLAYEGFITEFPDVTPPAAPSLTAQPTSTTSAYVSWTEAADNIGTAGYVVYRDGAQIARTAFRYYSDTGLTEGAAYSYRVVAFDAMGNVSELSAPAVAIMPDRTAPTVPQNVVATAVSPTQINLSWSPSTDNVAVVKYKVYRGTAPTSLTLIAAVSGTSYSNSNHNPQTTYHYAVTAMDAAYNTSAQSAVASATTLPPEDTTPPVVSIASPTAGSVVSGRIVLSASAYDVRSNLGDLASGVAGVQFKVDGVNAGAEVTKKPWYVKFDTKTVPNGTHVVTAVARDNAGWVTTSAPVSFTVNNSPGR
jgi:chitodextrinase